MKGQPVFGKVSGRKYKRTIIVSGQCKNCIVAPLQYSGTMDSALFLFWALFMCEFDGAAILYFGRIINENN